MAQRPREVVMFGFLLVAAFGCASGGEETGADSAPDTAPGVPTFADLQYIFDRNCTGACHAGSAPSEGMLLTEGSAHASLVGVQSAQVPGMMRVAPGDPDASYLMYKLQDTHTTVGGTGTKMPPYLVLADNELALFRDWIAAGAAP